MVVNSFFPKTKNFGSRALRTFFLFHFTRELIKHSAPTEVLELKTLLHEQKKQQKKRELPAIVKEKIKKQSKSKEIGLDKEYIPSILKHPKEKFLGPEKLPIFNLLPKQTAKPRLKKRIFGRLRIPETRLPYRLQYIKPTPTQVQIDLDKLNPLVRDPIVKAIECNGPDQEIMVSVGSTRKKTSIILNTEEINQVIEKFSKTSKIPVQEGILRIAIGKLILSAIISEVSDPKFIIRKIPGPLRPPMNMGRF